MFPINSIRLFSGPTRGNSVRSSEDCVLAVGLESGIALLPSYRECPRATCDLPGRRQVQMNAEIETDSGNRNLSMLALGPRYAVKQVPLALQKPESASYDWSPVGLSEEGGALLVVLTKDNQVREFPLFHPRLGTVSCLAQSAY